MKKQAAPRNVPVLTMVMLIASPVVIRVNEAIADAMKKIEPT